MISLIKKAYDSFFGAGEAAVTVPPMDGALLPNDALDRALLLHSVQAPDNLVLHGDQIVFSSGCVLFALASEGGPERIAAFDSEILAMASDGKDGLAIALAGAGILVRQKGKDDRLLRLEPSEERCVTALYFDADGHLLVAVGSSQVAAADWARDLLCGGATGSVLRLSPDGERRQLAGRLAWPAGVTVLPDGRIIASEAWRHRLISLRNDGRTEAVLGNLPAYPGRIGQETDGILLSLFAPRRQLVEFILREREFRETMMRDIAPELWMAPTLRPSSSFREPLQGGAVKQLGVLKPWAPTRSYGLLVRLDADFVPQASFHSRADGRRHGITSSLKVGNRLFITSKGGDAVLALAETSNERVGE
jgi:hypothetical protein